MSYEVFGDDDDGLGEAREHWTDKLVADGWLPDDRVDDVLAHIESVHAELATLRAANLSLRVECDTAKEYAAELAKRIEDAPTFELTGHTDPFEPGERIFHVDFVAQADLRGKRVAIVRVDE